MTSLARPARADEPAYPSHGTMGEVVQTGMTLREHFAAKAMQGMLAHFGDDNQTHDVTARMAVQMADAIIAELAKVKP